MKTKLRLGMYVLAFITSSALACWVQPANAQFNNGFNSGFNGGIGFNIGLNTGFNTGFNNPWMQNQGFCMTGMEPACYYGQGNSQFFGQWNQFGLTQPWGQQNRCMIEPWLCQGGQGRFPGQQNRVAQGGGRVGMPVSWAGQQNGYYNPYNPNVYDQNRGYQNPNYQNYYNYNVNGTTYNPITGQPM